MEEPKPCPFCGSQVYIVYKSREDLFLVYHKGFNQCYFQEPFGITTDQVGCLKEATDAWNRRVNK